MMHWKVSNIISILLLIFICLTTSEMKWCLAAGAQMPETAGPVDKIQSARLARQPIRHLSQTDTDGPPASICILSPDISRAATGALFPGTIPLPPKCSYPKAENYRSPPLTE